MSTKTALTTLINNNIRNKTPKVLKTEHADVEQGIVDNVYPMPIKEDTTVQGGLSITQNSAPGTGGTNGISYNAIFSKQGNQVFLDLVIGRVGSGTLSAQSIITILNQEYWARTNFPKTFYDRLGNYNITITGNVVYLNTSLPANATVILSGTYLAND